MNQESSLASYRITKPYLYYLVIYVALILFFVSDALNKYLYVNHELNGISDIIRAIFEIIFIILLFFQFNRNNYQLISYICFLFASFLIGQILFFGQEINFQVVLGNFKIFNKYIFLFLLYPSIAYIARKSPKHLNSIAKGLYYILLLNSTLVLLGFIYDITLFKSYPFKSYRFGYDGLIPKINEATLFSYIGICFIYFRRYILQIKLKKDYIILLAPLVLGAKGIYLFIFLLLIFHVLSKKNVIINTISVSLPLLGTLAYFVRYPEKLSYFSQQTREYGFFSMLLSGRNNILIDYSNEILKKWGTLNYFFGGQDQTYRMFEMDFIDLFFFFGIIGSLLYLFLLFITVFNLQTKRSFTLFLIFSYFLLAFLGGHFFASAINALYLCILTVYIKYNYNVQRDNNKTQIV